jgi:hypothetical protein
MYTIFDQYVLPSRQITPKLLGSEFINALYRVQHFSYTSTDTSEKHYIVIIFCTLSYHSISGAKNKREFSIKYLKGCTLINVDCHFICARSGVSCEISNEIQYTHIVEHVYE